MKLNRTKVTVLLTLVVPCLVLFVVDQMGQSKCLSVKLPTKEVVLKFEYSQVESDLPERVIAAPEWVKSILSIDEINISQIPLYLEHNLKDTLTLTSPSDDNKKGHIKLTTRTKGRK